MIKPGKKYSALIQGYPSDTSGFYPVYIAEIFAIDKTLTTIKVKNKLNNYGKWMYKGEVYSSGSYSPLHPGMNVTVEFATSSALSGAITEVHYDETPFDKVNQVGVHLVAKTPNGSEMYFDDARGITHIMHNNGNSNLFLTDDKITASINESSNVGSNFIGGLEIGKEGIYLKFGTTTVSLNESGIMFKVGEAEYVFDDKSFKNYTESYNMKLKNFEVEADKVFITGKEELQLKGTVSRLTGGQHLSLNGNIVNIDSNLNTTLQSTQSVNIKSLTNISLDSSIISADALASIMVKGINTTITGITTVVDGTTVAISGTNIFEDMNIIRGLGVATSVAAGSVASAIALKYSMQAADIALTTAFHFNDPFSGMAANVMTETLPGVAQGVPIQMPVVNMNPTFDYTNNLIQYIKKAHKIGNIGTVDTLNSLSGNQFKNLYLGNFNESSI